MKIYICGGSSELDLVESYMNRLRAMGHTITHDWVTVIRDNGSANPRDATHGKRSGWADQDLRGVEDATVVWFMMPIRASVGASLEVGYALGYGKRVIVSGDWRASIFTSKVDARFDTHDNALEWIRLYGTPGNHEEAMDLLEVI